MVEKLKLVNTSTGSELRFGINDEDYLIEDGGIDWGTVEANHNTFQYPTQIGVYKTSTQLGTRDVSITGWIIGEDLSEIEDKKLNLSKFINPLQNVKIIVGEYYLEGAPSTSVKFSSSIKENNEVMCKFLVQVFCMFPMWSRFNELNVSIADTQGVFGFPLTFKPEGNIMGLRKSSLFTDVFNDGAIEVGMELHIVAKGIVNNPEILNVKTKEVIKINKTLRDGESIVINTSQGARSVVGTTSSGVKENYFGYFDYDNTWLQLPVGSSTFTYRTYGANGEEDDTYKRLDVNLVYRPVLYSIGGE